jgi:glycosyltransferase involved in cell wall biosynthesis
MKIAFVIDAFNNGNGGCVATCRVAEGLQRRGHVISVVAAKSIRPEGFFQVKSFYGPGEMGTAMKTMDMPFGIPEKKVLRQAFAEADVVQIQFPFFLGCGAARLARKINKPVVGAFHVQPQNILGAMGKDDNRFLEFILFKFFNFLLFNQVPLIQCPSQFAADLLKRNGCRSEVRVVSNGILADYQPAPHARPDWFGDKLVLMTVGRQVLEKRQPLIIEGVKRSKYADKIQLLLCGKGATAETLTMMGAELPVKPFIQYVSHADKLKYLNTADLFILASIVELESLSCLEAIGCGLPCLICDSRRSAASQFALDPRFIFKTDDADSLAEKINYWYEHRAELKALRAQALAMAENYRFEKCLDKMEALYAEAIQLNQRAGS